MYSLKSMYYFKHILYYLRTTYRFSSPAPGFGLAQHPFLSLRVRRFDLSTRSSWKPSGSHHPKLLTGVSTACGVVVRCGAQRACWPDQTKIKALSAAELRESLLGAPWSFCGARKPGAPRDCAHAPMAQGLPSSAHTCQLDRTLSRISPRRGRRSRPASVWNGATLPTSTGFRGGTRAAGSKPSDSVGPLECGQQPRANGCHRASWE